MSSSPSEFNILRSFDYVDRDYDTMYERLLDLATSTWPTWARLRASWDNYMLGLVSHASDVVHFYRDNRLREAFLATAQLRQSVIQLGGLVGYELYGPTPASCDLVFTMTSGVAVGDVTIPAGAVIYTSGRNRLAFKTVADVVIAAGLTTAAGAAEHATARTENKPSDGTADQLHTLGFKSYIDGTMDIAAANGTYTEVETFLGSGPTDRHYVLATDTFARPVVLFGDAHQGEIPQGTITFNYDTGGGEIGNIEASTLTRLQGTYTDSFGNPVTLTVTNDEASGGDDLESLAHAKQSIPASLGNVRTTVSLEDYKNNTELVPGVARAFILTSDQDTSLPENYGRLWVAARGTTLPSGYVPPAEPSAALLADVQTMIETTRPKTITFQVVYVPVQFLDVDHVATVYFVEGYDPAEVAAAMLVRLQDFYCIYDDDGAQQETVRFGFEYKNAAGDSTEELAWSDVFNVLRDTPGVRKMEPVGGLYLNGLNDDVALGKVLMPRFHSLAVIDGDTGLGV